MHVAVVTGSGIPNPTSGGGALTAYTILSYALADGHDVTVFALHDVDYRDPTGSDVERRAAHLRSLGAQVVPIAAAGAQVAETGPASPLRRARRRLLWPSLVDLYPHVLDGERVRAAVAATDCDVAFTYHWEPLAASRSLSIPRVAGVGDPSHLPRQYRWLDQHPDGDRMPPQLRAVARGQRRAMARMLETCGEYGAFAAHHAEWLRTHGAPRCRYLRTPVPDDGAAWEDARQGHHGSGPVRILLLGHLAGIVTIDGLRVFTRMLPELDRGS